MSESKQYANIASAAMPQELPPALKQFMEDNDVREDVYEGASDLERHIRINPRNPITLILLATQLGHSPSPVSWLPSIYSLPSTVPLASCEAYKSGQVYGIDVASAAAVEILDPQPGDVVLDMCCAPGAKLCLTADIVNAKSDETQRHGFVVGVDVSQQRLASTKTVLRKYQHRNVRLYLADGTKCHIPCPRPTTEDAAARERAAWHQEVARTHGRIGPQRSRRKRRQESAPSEDSPEPTRYFFESPTDGHWGWGFQSKAASGDEEACSQDPAPAGSEHGSGAVASGAMVATTATDEGERKFDKVLVDAECTHDGSVRHIAKIGKQGWEQLEKRTFEEGRMEGLQELQRGLLLNGFRHLRAGGSLVYSTCSFSRRQNEEVVTEPVALTAGPSAPEQPRACRPPSSPPRTQLLPTPPARVQQDLERFSGTSSARRCVSDMAAGAWQWLLENESQAQLAPIPANLSLPCRPAHIEHAVRFEPKVSGSSGLFVAKVVKRP